MLLVELIAIVVSFVVVIFLVGFFLPENKEWSFEKLFCVSSLIWVVVFYLDAIVSSVYLNAVCAIDPYLSEKEVRQSDSPSSFVLRNERNGCDDACKKLISSGVGRVYLFDERHEYWMVFDKFSHVKGSKYDGAVDYSDGKIELEKSWLEHSLSKQDVNYLYPMSLSIWKTFEKDSGVVLRVQPKYYMETTGWFMKIFSTQKVGGSSCSGEGAEHQLWHLRDLQ